MEREIHILKALWSCLLKPALLCVRRVGVPGVEGGEGGRVSSAVGWGGALASTMCGPWATGAVLSPCPSSQPRASTSTWLTWTSTRALCALSPRCLVASQWGKTDGKYTQVVDLRADMLSALYGSWLSLATSLGGRRQGFIHAEIKRFAAGHNVRFDSKICAEGDDAHPRGSGWKSSPRGGAPGEVPLKGTSISSLLTREVAVRWYGSMEEPLTLEQDLPCFL